MSNITLKSPGRLFVNGSPDHPVENLRLHGLQWTLTGHLKLGSSGKPPGSARGSFDPDRVCHEFAKAQFTLAHVDGLSMSDVQLREERAAENPDRTLFYRYAVRNERIDGVVDDSIDWLDPESANRF